MLVSENRTSPNIVTPESLGAYGDGLQDDTAWLQQAITESYGKTLYLSGQYLISAGLDFTAWTGAVDGTGSIVCQSGVTIQNVLDFTNAKNVRWNGINLDMGQSATTLYADPRTNNGFYLSDARSCRFSNFDILNVRIGGPIYINGTSSVTPLDSHGSKSIFVSHVRCIAYPYSTVDFGAMIYVRSDFFTGDGGGLYFSASNACKVSDYTLDQTVAYKRTTSDIFFSDCHFENFDRFGYYNVKDVHVTNTECKNFYTRGHTMSPSVERVTIDGGTVSGNAAQITLNYACYDIIAANLVTEGQNAPVGQRMSLRCGYGSQRIRFSNISGLGNDVSLLQVEACADVTFDSISLSNTPSANALAGVTVTSGPVGNSTSFITRDIKFSNCTFGANYGLKFEVNGTGTIAQRGVKLMNCHFNKTLELFLTSGGGTMPIKGEIEWVNTTASVPGSSQTLDPRSFSVYEGSNISLKMTDTYTATGATTYATFSTVYFPTTLSDGLGQDNNRIPAVQAYIKKSGGTYYQPLLYGIDWFIDGTLAAAGMINQIRIYTPGNVAAGDTIAITRVR
ncbi:hypothetical protein GTP38_22235 [Duganella sp. FT94W]|uniref:Pectate lyase superfamily protein domain-containing protein n=1 Tax=Duganella lactea TaxID=2692173 RepID=A0ABW9VBN7_9BURK|nr:hypothetical protein [Duganella lactea]MYM37049.1 hypothetical protein [Duganella lactea]